MSQFFVRSPHACCLIQFDGRILRVNPAFEQLSGYREAVLVDRFIDQLFHPNDGRLLRRIWQQLRQEEKNQHLEVRFLAEAGHYIWMTLKFVAVAEEMQFYVYVVDHDAPAVKAFSEEFHSWEQKFAIIFNFSSVLMAVTSLTDNRLLDVNRMFLCQTGYERCEVIGRTTVELGIIRDADARRTLADQVIQSGSHRKSEIVYYTKGGEERRGLFSGALIHIQGNSCLLTSCTDITDYYRVKSEIAHLDRLNLVGQLAAGIGHEIRNPMTTVRGYLQLLGAKPENHRYRAIFDTMISEMDRANQIISEFLSLTRNKARDAGRISLNDLILSLLPLMEADAILQNKQVVAMLEDIPSLKGYEEELRQIILNLVRNGLESMEDGGTVTVRTYCQGDRCVVAIEDQGPGLPPHIREHLGTPFLTTKTQGIGLGLSICYSIASSHQATIDVASSSNGTIFSVSFPSMGDGQADAESRSA